MIRMAVVGCGGMSGGHVAALNALSGRAQVVATVDVDKERAESAAAKFDGAKAATEYKAVLDDVDAVSLVLPHHLHYPVGMECIVAGKHVLMEKPLANSERECLDLIEAAEAKGLKLMTAYCMRYHPLVVRMKELIDENAYGDCFHVSMWTEQHTEHPEGHWARSAATLGGGQLFSHGCHYIDLLLWYLGRPVSGTHVGTNYCTPWMEKEGTSNVSILFESGATAYHFGTWGAKGTRLGYSFHAHCSQGMIEAQISNGLLIGHAGDAHDIAKARGVAGKEGVLMRTDTGKHVANEMVHFIECIESGEKPLTDARASLQSLRVIWRLYEAEAKGAVADLTGLGLEQA